MTTRLAPEQEFQRAQERLKRYGPLFLILFGAIVFGLLKV